MESVELKADQEQVDANDFFTIDAVILPSYCTDRSLLWSTDRPDIVTITVAGDTACVFVSPTANDDEIVTIWAKNPEQDLEASMKFTISNRISVDIIVSESELSAGQSIPLVGKIFMSGSEPLYIHWSVDVDWVKIEQSGDEVVMFVDQHALQNDSFVVTARIVGTDIYRTHTFSVCDQLEIELVASSTVVQADSVFTVTVNSSPFRPNVPLQWSISSDSVSYIQKDNVLECRLDSNCDHNMEFTIHAKYIGFDAEASVIITTNNPSKIPIMIHSTQDLLSMRHEPSRHYILDEDLDMSTIAWVPFDFHGIFDGSSHTISGLRYGSTLESPDGEYFAGLFSVNYGEVKNIRLADASISIYPRNHGASTEIHAGLIAGVNQGSISNCIVESSSISAHSTSIHHDWASKYGAIPDRASGGSRDGPWFDFASLRFTGVFCKSWEASKRMAVFCGGIVGSNLGSVKNCCSDAHIDARVINFNYNSNVKSNAVLYAGGVVGTNEGTLANSNSSGKVIGGLYLHHSGSGGSEGLGWVDPYVPAGEGHVGGVAGLINGSATSCYSTSTINNETEVFAPVYFLLDGAHYNVDGKGSVKRIEWSLGQDFGSIV